jgi:hypothetical protein
MKLSRMVAALFLGLALCSSALAQPLAGGGPSKWFHHEKKNPNRKKVAHHPKPTHRVTKQKTRKHS